MKLVTAVIQPRMLERLASALRRANVPGMTVLDARGFGKETLAADWDQLGIMTAKVLLEIVAEDDQVDAIVELIHQTVRTGKAGDGIIYVSDLERIIKISTTKSTGEYSL